MNTTAYTRFNKYAYSKFLGPAYSTLLGAAEAAGLTDEEAAALREHYGLSQDASLAVRNAGRGIVGGFIGSNLGALPGKFMTRKALRSNNLAKKLSGAAQGAYIAATGRLGGGLLGTVLSTDKYSKENAKRILGRSDDTIKDKAGTAVRNSLYGASAAVDSYIKQLAQK